MRDPVENNLPRGRLSSLNGVLLRIAVKEDIQFRNLGNPTAIDFPIQSSVGRKLPRCSDGTDSLPARSTAGRPTTGLRDNFRVARDPGVISQDLIKSDRRLRLE